MKRSMENLIRLIEMNISKRILLQIWKKMLFFWEEIYDHKEYYEEYLVREPLQIEEDVKDMVDSSPCPFSARRLF